MELRAQDGSTTCFQLAEAVALFDRRERRAVIRALGGEDAAKVCTATAGVLGPKLGIKPAELEGAPWFMDYPWNWLAGAITLFHSGSREPRGDLRNEAGLIKRNHEDIDALIVAGNHLVLIEAKWGGVWKSSQLNSKVERMRALMQIVRDDGVARPLSWHLVLASRGGTSLKKSAENIAGKVSCQVTELPLSDLFGELPTGLLEVPHAKDGSSWSIVRSRAFRQRNRAAGITSGGD